MQKAYYDCDGDEIIDVIYYDSEDKEETPMQELDRQVDELLFLLDSDIWCFIAFARIKEEECTL